MNHLFAYITAKNISEARKISQILLKKRLIACSNIITKIESSYWWNGKLQRHYESLIFAKTESRMKNMIIREVKKIHSYSIPCILFFKVEAGNSEYFSWARKEIG